MRTTAEFYQTFKDDLTLMLHRMIEIEGEDKHRSYKFSQYYTSVVDTPLLLG